MRRVFDGLRVGLGLLIGLPGVAWSAPMTPEEIAAVERRLVVHVDASPSLELPVGDTRFVVHRLPRPPGLDPERVQARITGIVTPRGIGIRTEVERFEVRGDIMLWVVPIHARPDARSGGDVRYDLNLVERRGLGNSVLRSTVRTKVRLTAATFTETDLARDFAGYRRHRARARRAADRLRAARFPLTLEDDGPVPPTDRLREKGRALLRLFLQDRHRLAVATRHLQTARRSTSPGIRDLAEVYWANRDRPRDRWAGVPPLVLVGPVAAEPPPASPADGDVIAPITTYAPGSDAPAPPPDDTPAIGPAAGAGAAAAAGATPSSPVAESTAASPADPDAELRAEVDDEETLPTIPGHRRSLSLDDPNIAHGGSVRFIWAEANVRESALTAAIFYFAQAGLTKDLGLEVTVPTQFVELRDIDADSVYTNGNPLVALKYRFHLPAWGGRRSALTARARLGIPFSPPSKLSPSDITAESFTQQVHFVDTWAFLADFWDVGLGANWAWTYRWLTFGSQLYLDYYIPLDDDDDGLFGIGYGAGVGYTPVQWVTAWVDARATSLVGATSRTEMVAYTGVRFLAWGLFEPAAYVGFPIGSIAESSSVQIGIEVRIAHDRLAWAGKRPSLPSTRGGAPR